MENNHAIWELKVWWLLAMLILPVSITAGFTWAVRASGNTCTISRQQIKGALCLHQIRRQHDKKEEIEINKGFMYVKNTTDDEYDDIIIEETTYDGKFTK